MDGFTSWLAAVGTGTTIMALMALTAPKASDGTPQPPVGIARPTTKAADGDPGAIRDTTGAQRGTTGRTIDGTAVHL